VEVGVEAKWPKGSVVMGKGSHKVVAHCITDMGGWEKVGRGFYSLNSFAHWIR
jgi:hypothetical protein